MAPFRLVVFDLDGTLVDSKRDLADAANAVLVESGAEPLTEERIGRMIGDGAATLVARAFEASRVVPPPDALRRFLAIYDSHLLRSTRPYPEVPEMLATLAGRSALAVLTNKPLVPTRAILSGLDLARYFPADCVLGGDGPLPRKPDPSGLRRLMAIAHVRPDETLMVGDSIIDRQTARSAGAHACVARYGFGFQTFPAEEVDCQDLAIDSPSALLTL